MTFASLDVRYDSADTSSMRHESIMRRCLALAEQGRGSVGNGALVGAVLVRDGSIIAEAFHSGYGKPHAERELLEKFDQKISSNDVLYVNLEPCCHAGKTPPCVDIIRERGVRHVVFGIFDPDERVAGRGIAALRENGITVTGPVLPAQCARLNRGFLSVRTKHRPWITLKTASTRAGEISMPDGSPRKITSHEQDEWSHAHLRAMHDAILVGIGTVRNDNPELNTRLVQDGALPYRVILDPSFSISLDARVVADAHPETTIVCIAEGVQCDESKKTSLQERGAHVWEIDMSGPMFAWPKLWEALCTPRERFHGITSVLVEGGAETWRRFREAGCVDEEVSLVGA